MRFLFLVLSLALTGHGALPHLAYFGALQGQINVPNFPILTWSLTAAEPDHGRQSAVATFTAEGLSLHATLAADETTGVVTWQIAESRVQLGPWLAALAPRFAPALAGAIASGELTITGQGILDGTQPRGTFSLHCADASLAHAGQGWTLTGITFDGEFALAADATVASTRPFSFGIRTISTARFGARAFKLSASLQNLTQLSIDSARVEIAGGEVVAEPFVVPLSPPVLDVKLHITHVGLQDIVALMPSSGLAEARGLVGGEMNLGWDKTNGVRIGVGRLTLDEHVPTVLRLVASPGFLTEHIPARFEFLPGPLGRWLSFRNQAYDDLRDIELGRVDLTVESLRLLLTPAGNGEGHTTARVLIDASPIKSDASVKKVVFTVNIFGPLPVLLNLGMTQNFTTELH